MGEKEGTYKKLCFMFFQRGNVTGSRKSGHQWKLNERSFSLSHSTGPNLQKHEQTCILRLVFFLDLCACILKSEQKEDRG